MADTAVVTLADFLLARIAEDEAEAKAQNSSFLRNHGPGALLEELNGYGLHWLVSSVTAASHVLAECEAKRRIMELHKEVLIERLDDEFPGDSCDALCVVDNDDFPCETLRLLALPYADHPDYREEWRG